MTQSKKPKEPLRKKSEANYTVKSLSKKFVLDVKTVMDELKSLGVEVASQTSHIDDEISEIVLHHFEEVVKKAKRKEAQAAEAAEAAAPNANEIHLKSPVMVKALAEAIDKKPNEVITRLLKMNVLASINQSLDSKVAERVCEAFGFKLVLDHRQKVEEMKRSAKDEAELKATSDAEERPEDLVPRPPVVAFLGHVDHGKTSIQDALRHTNVVKGEAGGITQHIGASVIAHKDKSITFIDTPGHEAFTAMRARGANATDIAVLVVAADDGFMPQTIEALNHLKAANVPIIVAANKMDLPSANYDRILLHMQQNGLMSEEWGGEVGVVKVSAITKAGLPELLDRIFLEAEMLELKGNPKRPAEGVVLEAELGQGTGATASVLVRNGTLHVGDIMLCGPYSGRVKAMVDVKGHRVKAAGPSTPVKVMGLSGVPNAGDIFVICDSEKDAVAIAGQRFDEQRTTSLTREVGVSLEDLFATLDRGKRNDLHLIIKTDVKGTAEAIIDALGKIPSEKISVEIVLAGVGAISEADVLLAAASGSIVVGFHVKVNTGVNALAKDKGVEIRLYSVIYELMEDITDALVGRLAPDKREKELGVARILKIFSMTKGPKVCGCLVESGSVKAGSMGRIYRGKELLFNGTIQTLRRFQDEVKEVKTGQECGIRMDNFLDFQEGDEIKAYEIELRKATLA